MDRLVWILGEVELASRNFVEQKWRNLLNVAARPPPASPEFKKLGPHPGKALGAKVSVAEVGNYIFRF